MWQGLEHEHIVSVAFCLLPFSVFESGHKLEYMNNFLSFVLILVLAKWWFDGVFLTLHLKPKLPALAKF